RELPELAALVGSLENNPLPAAFEVRLREGQDEEGLRSLVQALEGTQAVEDVRYDRRIIDRMMGGLRLLRRGGALLAAIMVFTALVTITSVLRLAYLSRRDEIEVLFLMGLPPAAIRGPFVVEGMLQTAAGAAIALVLLAVAFGMVHARIGSDVGQAFGVGVAAFLSPGMTVLVLITSIVVGAVAGCAAAWKEP
ncbi:MAG TPA: FtsX-like permease family protein, partial [Vicinamibacterales bacterium]